MVGRERALELLEFNTDNRNVQRIEVRRMVSDMHSGRFQPRVSDVRVSSTGVLLDGQHTLLAVVESGLPAWLTVHLNASDGEWSVIDSGTKRTVAQALGRMGYPQARNLAAVAKAVMVWRETGYPGVSGAGAQTEYGLSRSIIIEFADANAEELLPHVRRAVVRSKKMPLMPATWIAALSVALSDADRDLGDSFMAQLFGEVEAVGVMPLRLRERLSIIAMRSADHRPGSAVLLGMSIKAFNAWVSGREIRKLSWGPRQDFPQITIPEGVK